MKRIKSGTKGTKGEAKVRIGKGQVQIIFKAEPDDPYTFPKSELPESVKAGIFHVTLTGDGEFLAIRPLNAVVRAKFSHFYAEEGEAPAWKEYPGGTATTKDGKKTFSYEAYRGTTAILDITDKEYKGMTIPVFLRDVFINDGDGNIAIKGNGKNADLAESFLEVTGVYDKEIPYSENVLPKLQKAIMKAGCEFQVMLKNGNADSFMELPDLDEESDDNDEDDWEVAEEDFEDEEEEKDEIPF